MTNIAFERYTGEQTLAMLEDIADLYSSIRTERQDADPIFSRESFITRTSAQAVKTGFEFIAARKAAEWAGFSFGYSMLPGEWWADATPQEPDVLAASKIAVIELDVVKSYRGQGLSKALLQELLANRSESFATLASLPGTQANAMYLRWGWRKVGIIGGEGPVMDAMLLPLRA